MIQYLTILLDDTSVSYCHYNNDDVRRNLIDKDVLKKNLIWAMKENVNIQFVYPNYDLPKGYDEIIDIVDSIKIKKSENNADVVVLEEWDKTTPYNEDTIYIIKTSRKKLIKHVEAFCGLLCEISRVNIVFTDTLSFKDDDIEDYKSALETISEAIVKEFLKGRRVQVNCLTDRIMLEKMNNCDAGVCSITLAPNGKFYLCPAFYYDNPEDSIGDITNGVSIKNQQLLKLDHAPLCRLCDAYQCKRCVWMNKRSTLDINTPSHQQCVISHIERNASMYLLKLLKENGIYLHDAKPIKEIDYLDPFNEFCKWK